MAEPIGSDIGRYHIIERLGEGGMASVYKAYDVRLDRDVAIKIIRTDYFTPVILQPLLKRFEREAREMARFNHPNIVTIYDYGEYEKSPYLVMQYLSGGTLKEKISGKRLPYPEAACITAAVANALNYAHQRGIIHRDVKPANILITDEGDIKLSDFGIAKVLENEPTTQITNTGVGIGTPQYMAPEQWKGKTIAQTDIYSLGVVFFELLTGRRPYEADTPAAIFEKILVEPLPRPGVYVPGLPDEVERVLYKALAKKPENRYSTMAEFAAALEKLAVQRDTSEDSNETLKMIMADGGLVENPLAKKQELSSAKAKKTPANLSKIFWMIGCAGILGVIAFAIFLMVIIRQGFAGGGAQAQLPAETLTSTSASLPTQTVEQTTTPEPVFISAMISNIDGMEMVFVPEGEFEIGSNDGDSDEQPVHTVFLDGFWIDKYEVNNAQYAQCVSTGKCDAAKYQGESDFNMYNQPVVGVDPENAQAYCQWAGRRLPSEAEWEKAARGTDGRIYPWGNQPLDGSLANIADTNLNSNSSDGGFDDGYKFTAPVGSFPDGASPYGALDMAGNVLEWVTDWYAKEYYSVSPSENPQGASLGEYRIMRGGSWGDVNPESARSANRIYGNPNGRSTLIGFRCVVSE